MEPLSGLWLPALSAIVVEDTLVGVPLSHCCQLIIPFLGKMLYNNVCETIMMYDHVCRIMKMYNRCLILSDCMQWAHYLFLGKTLSNDATYSKWNMICRQILWHIIKAGCLAGLTLWHYSGFSNHWSLTSWHGIGALDECLFRISSLPSHLHGRYGDSHGIKNPNMHLQLWPALHLQKLKKRRRRRRK